MLTRQQEKFLSLPRQGAEKGSATGTRCWPHWSPEEGTRQCGDISLSSLRVIPGGETRDISPLKTGGLGISTETDAPTENTVPMAVPRRRVVWKVRKAMLGLRTSPRRWRRNTCQAS